VWRIVQTEVFGKWFAEQDEDAQVDMREKFGVLREFGPRLGRPYVDTVRESKHPNMKELRVQSRGRPFRVIFAFDPKRNAVLLIGGNKEGDKRFYKWMIPKADHLLNEYLEDTK